MKDIIKNIFETATHLGVAWMIAIVVIFIITMIFNISFIPTWLWLIFIVPGFSMVIADREPDSAVGGFGLILYNMLNFFGDGTYTPTHVVEDEETTEEKDNDVEEAKAAGDGDDQEWEDEIFTEENEMLDEDEKK